MREWLPRFATIGQPVTLEDLVLFGDAYYLPHEEGPEAEELYHLTRSLLAGQAPFTRPADTLSPTGGEGQGEGARFKEKVSDARVRVSKTAGAPAAECLTKPPPSANAPPLREFCVRMTELKHRPLFYALSRRIWELREELDLLERYVEFKSKPGQANSQFGSDFHLPGTYRGGLVARLQRYWSCNRMARSHLHQTTINQ